MSTRTASWRPRSCATEGVRVGIRSGHNGFTYGLLYGRELARRAAITEQLGPFLS